MSAAELPYRPCVGIMLINRERQVLVGERRDMPGAWQMPQGGIDAGETIRQAAIRELREETGVTSVAFLAESATWLRYDLPAHLVGRVWRGRYRGQQQKWVALAFNGHDDEIDLHGDHGEFERWQWSSPDKLISDIVDFKRDVYRQVVEEFAELLY